jgi:hypothetical protein
VGKKGQDMSGTDQAIDEGKRAFLGVGAIVGVGVLAAGGCTAMGEQQQAAAVKTFPDKPPGKPGDFDFLQGDWKIRNRQRKVNGGWIEFDGESTCRTILKGVVSIEELRIPVNDFSGMGLRTLDIENKVWSDIWMNAKSGVVFAPGVLGYFENGAGIFDSEDVENGKPVIYRGIWDMITPTSCRWRQGASRDGGSTFDYTWIMEWTRA